MKTKTRVGGDTVAEAYLRIKDVVVRTPLEFNERLSKKYKARVFIKREDLQAVRSYKLRGAYNRISLLSQSERKRGVVCASAGNHAQGVAFSCNHLKIKGLVYMPQNTPRQKVERVRVLGGRFVSLALVGDSFEEAFKESKKVCRKEKKVFIHPFDDWQIIAGQGTVTLEILEQLETAPDVLVVPVGGGGLAAGASLCLDARGVTTELIGAEPESAPSMSASLSAGRVTPVEVAQKFVDGAAVSRVGEKTFSILKKKIKQMVLVSEGKVCQEMIELYQSEGVVAEPAGALSVAALESVKEKIEGKSVVCVLSGGNNDVARYPEVIERSLIFQGLKHYFMAEFPQRPGALRQYLDEVLGPSDDITFFEYVKKNYKESGPVLVGIELARKEDLLPLMRNMDKVGFAYTVVDNGSPFFRFFL